MKRISHLQPNSNQNTIICINPGGCGDNSCAITDRRMEMKRSFVYLVLALLLCLLLCACGDTTGHGNVTASPWPDVTAPVMPTPTADFSASPIPNSGTDNKKTGNDTTINNGSEPANNGMTGTSTSSPVPTDDNR